MNIKKLLEDSGYSFLEYCKDLYTTSNLKHVLLVSKTNKELFICVISESIGLISIFTFDDYQKQIDDMPDKSVLKKIHYENSEVINIINMLR